MALESLMQTRDALRTRGTAEVSAEWLRKMHLSAERFAGLVGASPTWKETGRVFVFTRGSGE